MAQRFSDSTRDSKRKTISEPMGCVPFLHPGHPVAVIHGCFQLGKGHRYRTNQTSEGHIQLDFVQDRTKCSQISSLSENVSLMTLGPSLVDGTPQVGQFFLLQV